MGGQLGPLEEGDISDSNRLRAVREKYDPVALMDFAAYTHAQRLLDYHRNNVAGTAALLQTLIDFRLLPVVFSSDGGTDSEHYEIGS
jgi:UDP-glucose 4-epimerase